MQEYTSFNQTITFLNRKNKSIFNNFSSKMKYLNNMIYPTPCELPIDIKLFPFEKTHSYINDYKKIKNILMNNKKINGIYLFNRQKYNLHGKISINNNEISFRINFYKIGPNKYIIEFQRRDGCALTWYKHYQEMKNQILHLL